MADADELAAARTFPQPRQRRADVGRGEVDPPDDAGHERATRRDGEELLGLVEVGENLDEHGRIDAERGRDRRQVVEVEAAVDRPPRSFEPLVPAGDGIPDVVVSVDYHPSALADLELVPEPVRDRPGEVGGVGEHLLRRAGADDRGRHRRRPERELEGGRGEPHPVRAADPGRARRAAEHLAGRRHVVVALHRGPGRRARPS